MYTIASAWPRFRPLAWLAAVFIGISTLTRLALLIATGSGIPASPGYWLYAFLVGFGYDLLTFVYFAWPLVLLLWLMPQRWYAARFGRFALAALCFVHPLTILLGIPSAAMGAFLALRLAGLEISFIAMIGVLLLIGIVKKNAIMMIGFAIDAQRRGSTPAAEIREACRLRLRPILMTTLCAMMGALPIALGWGAGAELRQPLGVAIVGGLLVSQVITLFITPVVYLWFDELGHRWLPRRAAGAETS